MLIFERKSILLIALCMNIVIFAKSIKKTDGVVAPFSTGHIHNKIKNPAENDTESCKLEILPGEFENVKTKLLKIMSNDETNLVYIHILIKDKSYDTLKEGHRYLKNRIMEWQYVDKKEKFLVQLPVDIDMVTFNMLKLIGEENQIAIPMKAQNMNCTYSETTVQNIKHDLWGKLLGNFSDNFVLCNRNFSDAERRTTLYWITTIWMGYDLMCTTKYDNEIIDVGKFSRPNIIPMVCFILALQYIWIYAFLKFDRENDDFHYEKSDSPYSMKRAVQKFLYRRLYTQEMETEKDKTWTKIIKRDLLKLIHSQIDSPAMRLISVFYFIILLPVSLYRTIYRWNISDTEVHDYLTILKPSEPLCSLCSTDIEAYRCDLAIAILSTIFGAFLFYIVYDILAGKMCKNENNEDGNDLAEVFKHSCTRWKFKSNMKRPNAEREKSKYEVIPEEREEQPRVSRNKEEVHSGHGSGHTENLCTSGEVQGSGIPKQTVKNDCKELLKTGARFLLLALVVYMLFLSSLVFGILYLIYVVVSLIVLIFWFMIYPLCYHCQNEKGCCKRCCKPRGGLFVMRILLLIFLSMCLIFCQRTIVSSITFLLRLMTYFIFVALPARVNLFRYFLIVVTALTYILKYHTELVNMATEILDEIFKNLAEMQGSNDENETEVERLSTTTKINSLKEEIFDKVIIKLKFSYRWHVFIIKCLVLIIYIFITVEALLNSGSLKSSNHFEQFLAFLFIALSPAIVQRLYKTRHGYLSEKHKTIIRNEVALLLKEELDNA